MGKLEFEIPESKERIPNKRMYLVWEGKRSIDAGKNSSGIDWGGGGGSAWGTTPRPPFGWGPEAKGWKDIVEVNKCGDNRRWEPQSEATINNSTFWRWGGGSFLNQ